MSDPATTVILMMLLSNYLFFLTLFHGRLFWGYFEEFFVSFCDLQCLMTTLYICIRQCILRQYT